MRIPAYRALPVVSIALLLSDLPTLSPAQPSDTRGAAWQAYSRASEAFAECRMQGRAPPPCAAERAALYAAEARYRTEIDTTQAIGQH